MTETSTCNETEVMTTTSLNYYFITSLNYYLLIVNVLLTNTNFTPTNQYFLIPLTSFSTVITIKRILPLYIRIKYKNYALSPIEAVTKN